MSDWFRDVLEFHTRFGCHTGTTPATPPADVTELRAGLIDEERDELRWAMLCDDLPGIADGAVDLVYVVLGTLAAYGIDPRPVWEAVHASNLAKAGGGMRPDGKVLKAPGWQPPDVAGLLARQGPIGEADPPARCGCEAAALRPGQIYRHYKGGLYVVVCASVKEDTQEPLVTYRSNPRGSVMTRTLENFLEPVDVGTHGPTDMRPRFTRVEE